MRIMVTGAAGFIGSAASLHLLDRGDEVLGIDNLDDYYDVDLKRARLKRTEACDRFSGRRIDITDRQAVFDAVAGFEPQRMIHLAAQTGVRHSVENPFAHLDANLAGFMNVLEACRRAEVEHLVYASSSSVYGANARMPFSVHHPADHPLSMYAATKKANELMAHAYSHLHRLPTTGLRFFTVYGPWGRPDMALFRFTRNILAGRPIEVFNYGNHRRDFTYIDDAVESIARALGKPPEPVAGWDADAPDCATSAAPYRLYDVGASQPVELERLIKALEASLGKKAEIDLLPLQPGDMPDAYADAEDLAREIGFRPATTIEAGVGNFVDWYRDFYGV